MHYQTSLERKALPAIITNDTGHYFHLESVPCVVLDIFNLRVEFIFFL